MTKLNAAVRREATSKAMQRVLPNGFGHAGASLALLREEKPFARVTLPLPAPRAPRMGIRA